jgi:RimJ/RimL family protein N-acetyltransferase
MQSKLNSMETVDSRPELRTKRLWLRPFQASDAQDLERLANDKEIAANTRSIDYPYPAGQGIKWIEPQADSWLAGTAAVFAICHQGMNRPPKAPQVKGQGRGQPTSGQLMGAIGLEICEADQLAELGYWIGRDFRGLGYVTEAAEAVVAFGFEILGLNKIHSQHMARNPKSGRVMEKIGMQQEGILRRHVRKWGVFEDVVVYGILNQSQTRES